jgi:hypothetical protein
VDGEGEGEGGVEERAFRVVKQEVGAGIGVLLIRVLLAGGGGDVRNGTSGTGMESRSAGSGTGLTEEQGERNVDRALVVVGDMIRSERVSTVREGVEVLAMLVSGIGSSSSSSFSISSSRPQGWTWTPPHALYDGTLLLPGGLGTLLQGEYGSAFGSGFGSGDVKQLTEREIGRCWEVLIRVWGEGVDMFLTGGGVVVEMEKELRKVVCVSVRFLFLFS